MPVNIVTADITTLRVDAIVNAANPSLLGGGGVDGAIHRAAGPALLDACRQLPESAPGVRCPTGEARITPGFALPAAYVIHTVGPVWHGGGHGEPMLLARCYRNALQLSRKQGLRTIAFPAISCGVYGYPLTQAAAVAVAALRAELPHADALEITLCCFSEDARTIFQHVLDAARAGDEPFSAA
ncbi:MAG TPA: O-acetyl-ADP-ribose deacetylase [Rhodanobacter sp.]|nr:O-acetyl-ADP-ribose deacetylase [Rhodanobacter sp.]